ncbi:MAG: oligosaccharide flippase family protein [Rhodobacteraceae bacterium]|nr:oligosaccharide flippase family protein [Paracoccaceae bacterium]
MFRPAMARFGRLPDFARNALISFPVRISGLFLQLISSIILARLLGVTEFGVYSYAFVWATILGLFLSAGLDQLGLRELPRFIAQPDAASLVGFLLAIFGTIAVSAILIGGILWYLQSREFFALGPGWLLIAGVALTHALALSFANIHGGFQKILTAQVMENLPKQVLFLILIVSAAVAGLSLDAQNTFTLYLLSIAPILAISAWIALRETRRSTGIYWPPRLQMRFWYAASLPMALTGAATFVNTNLDILMVGTMLGDVDTGIYRAASRAAALAAIFQMVALRVLGPMLSRAIAQDDYKGAQRLLAYSAGFASAAGGVFCLLLVTIARPYLGLFGAEFTAGVAALNILVIAQTLILPLGAVALLATFKGHERAVFLANMAGLAFNFALNFLLIQWIGIEGAAISTGLTLLAVNGGLLIFIRRKTPLDPTILSTLRLFRAR